MRKDEGQRDTAVDRLLRHAFPHDDAAETPDCLDADTLAAWADGGLDARELAAAQAHAADCARCQAMLAAMARTAPAAPTTAATRTWSLSLAWLVPASAAAAALAFWLTSVPTGDLRPAQSPPSQQVARDETPRPPTPATPADALVPKTQTETTSRLQTRERQQKPAEVSGAEADKKSLDARRANELADAAARSANGRLEKSDAAENVAPPASAAASPERTDAFAPVAGRAQATAPTSAAGAPPAAAPAQPAAAGAAARTFAFGAAETVIVSSNPGSRWRLLPNGDVQRSADGGATWQTQTTGATEALTSGSSPSPSVCWLVGPNGVVLLSADGRSWRRLAFPEHVALIKIVATDDQTATVTTADGRVFVTDDGGRTWTRAPRP